MGPVEHGAQGLLTVGPVALAVGQQRQAFVECCHQARQAQQRQARRGHFDGQRAAVELPAKVQHGRQRLVVQLEAARGGAGAFDEQRHSAKSGGLRQAGARRRQRHATQAKGVFGAQAQGRLAGDDHAHVRCEPVQAIDDTRHFVQQMLGVVQRQQQAQRRHGFAQAGQRVVPAGRNAQRRGDGARHGGGFSHWRQVDEADAVFEAALRLPQQVLGQKRLAGAAGTQHRDDAVGG